MTLVEYASVTAAATAVLSAGLGVTIRLARAHIARRIDITLDTKLDPIHLELKTMNGEITRIRVIEAQINNGLTDRQERIETKLDHLYDHLLEGTPQ